MAISDPAESFHSVIYAPDGECLGEGAWRIADLSERWLSLCTGLLSHYGPIFRHNMGSTLSHFDIQFTAGLAHFISGGHLAFSSAYMPGVVAAQDVGVLTVFSSQVLGSSIVQRLCPDPRPFESNLQSHTERPLSISIVWGNPEVTQEDQDALFQLGNHLAGAYLCGYSRAGAA